MLLKLMNFTIASIRIIKDTVQSRIRRISIPKILELKKNWKIKKLHIYAYLEVLS